MEKILIEDIPQREPVLNAESAEQFETKRLNHQWLLLTEVIRKEILSEPETRELVASFIDSPVSEALPAEFLEKVASNPRVAQLTARYKDELGTYLKIESVPDEQLQPDITHAATRISPSGRVSYLQSVYGEGTSEFYKALQEQITDGKFLNGVTVQEKLLTAQRYRFARDVKMLALQAEVEGSPTEVNRDGCIELASGTTVMLNVEDEQVKQDLLNPQNWERRKQIKDRVYVIQVGESWYILKEKKTARHTDTKKGGHKSGLSSHGEFETAKYFQENGQVEKGNVGVVWEKPLATVKFPDEYQFTIFEYEQGLLEEGSVQETLCQQILENAEQFVDEYETVRDLATTYIDSPQVLMQSFEPSESFLKKLLTYVGLKKEDEVPGLSFADFAQVKALRMTRQSRDLMSEIMLTNGYSNSDTDGYAYKINQKEGRVQLEICGFDFEYFRKITEQVAKKRLESYKYYSAKDGIGFVQWGSGEVTRTQRAGYLALLASEGIFPEPDEN